MKNKGGRPFGTEPTVRKSYSITVHQEIWIKATAKRIGISESHWVRLCIEAAMQTAREAMKLREIEKFCGNCNGSGQGMFDRSICWECKGKGVVTEKAERDEYDDE
jgi:hypothetical protein